MGFLYKTYQKACYKSLELAREKGIKADKDRLAESRGKRDVEFKENIGINWGVINKKWRNFD